MRHQKHRHSLGVTVEHREALLANLGVSLIEHGRIRTTLSKAKALRPFIERVITLAKKGGLHHRRLALSRLRSEDAVTNLFNERAPMFANRPGGYTRIYKLGPRRIGDAAEMALIELIAAEDTGYKKSRKKKPARKKAAAGAAAEAPATPESSGAEGAEPAQEARS